MNYFNSNQSLGEIVSIIPKAAEIFKEYQIDFCCGGNRSLLTALEEKSLGEEEVLKRLDEAYEESRKYKNQFNYLELSSSELIDYIVDTHHSYTKKILPEISELTTKILRVHGVNHKELFQIHKLFHNLKMELEQHLIKEEEILFPLIKDYEKNPSNTLLQQINETVREAEEEHTGAGDILKELRKITNDYKLPEDACRTYENTYLRLKELEADLFTHIHLENNILFHRLGIVIMDSVQNVSR